MLWWSGVNLHMCLFGVLKQEGGNGTEILVGSASNGPQQTPFIDFELLIVSNLDMFAFFVEELGSGPRTILVLLSMQNFW